MEQMSDTEGLLFLSFLPFITLLIQTTNITNTNVTGVAVRLLLACKA